MTILIFFIILILLIFSHELGHFIFARLKGVKVEEFGFGFPPRLFGIKKGETLYSVNLLPLGGFVRIFGENGPEQGKQVDPEEVKRAFYSQPKRSQALILSAGVLFNFLLAWIIFSISFMLGTPMSVSSSTSGEIKNVEVVISAIQEDSPAEKTGLQLGDRIIGLTAGQETIKPTTISEIQGFISRYKGQELRVDYKRGGLEFSTTAIPDVNPPPGRGALGIVMDEIGTVSFPWYRAIWEGIKRTLFLIGLIIAFLFNFFKAIFTGGGVAILEQVAGPVGIVGLVGTAYKFGFIYVLQLAALLSINLAIINLLPIPALDGGRLLFLGIETVKGSPINQKWSNIVNAAGFIFILVLMALITYKDILRF